MKRMDFKLKNVANFVVACVILHNMCEIFEDHFLQEWASHEEHNPPVPPYVPSSSCNVDAANIRNASIAIKRYLSGQ